MFPATFNLGLHLYSLTQLCQTRSMEAETCELCSETTKDASPECLWMSSIHPRIN